MDPQISLDFMARRRVPSFNRNQMWSAQPVVDHSADFTFVTSYRMLS
jgi:hypothetical protein